MALKAAKGSRRISPLVEISPKVINQGDPSSFWSKPTPETRLNRVYMIHIIQDHSCCTFNDLVQEWQIGEGDCNCLDYLGAVLATTCILNPCPSGLLKVAKIGLVSWLQATLSEPPSNKQKHSKLSQRAIGE